MKEEVIQLVETFGLYVDLDSWEDKGWLRVKSNDWPEDFGYRNNCLILYKDDVEKLSMQYVKDELIQNLLHLGGKLKAKEIRKLIMY
jgi:hypothetical protein